MGEKEMLYKFYQINWKYPVKDDWTSQVQKDIEDLKIDMSLEEIKQKSEYSFKRYVKIKMKEYCLEYLLNEKESHSKMDNMHYVDLKIPNYLTSINLEQEVQSSKKTIKTQKQLCRYSLPTMPSSA